MQSSVYQKADWWLTSALYAIIIILELNDDEVKLRSADTQVQISVLVMLQAFLLMNI